MTWSPPPHERDVELRPLLLEEGWRTPMEVIARRHDLPVEGLVLFPSGSDVVFGGEGYVIKLTSPVWPDDFDHECAFVEHFSGRLDLEVPEVMARGEIEGWPYLVLTRLGGTSLTEVWTSLDHDERRRLAARLGAMTAALHAVPPPAPREDWGAFLSERREGVIAHHRRRGVGEPWLARMEAFLDDVPRPDRSAVLLHTELLGEHVLLRRAADGWEPTGLIDWVDAKVGHPDYEVAALVEFVFRGEAGCLGDCLAAYGWSADELDHGGGRRLAAWGLLHEFADLGRALSAAGAPEPEDFDALVRRVYDLEVPPIPGA